MKKKPRFNKSLAVKLLSFHLLTVITITAHLGVVLLSLIGGIFPGHEALMNIIGSCAEIIAGLYGITLASYTFFLSRIDALTATDSTLEYVVESVKNRYNKLIWYITVNVGFLLLISILLMYLPPVQDAPTFFYRLFCNQFLLFLVYSIALILYYSIGVISPNGLEKQAARLKNRLCDPDGRDGDAFAFLSLYSRIEAFCEGLIPEDVLQPLIAQKGRRFSCVLGLLQLQSLIPEPLQVDLLKLYRYHSCMVNCDTLCVKEEMCDLARQTLQQLESPPMEPEPLDPPSVETTEPDTAE